MKFTAIVEKAPQNWYLGQIKEFPAAISQGRDIAELKANLLDALDLLIEPKKLKPEIAIVKLITK